MSVVMWVAPTVLMIFAVLLATAPWGPPAGAAYALPLMPYMVAHLFIARGHGFVPSPVVFGAGLAMDIATGGPLGFWALIYLSGVLVARQLPGGAGTDQMARLSGLLLIVFVLAAMQVGVASLYQLRWIDWFSVLGGTAVAGLIAAAADVVLQVGMRRERGLKATQRGSARARV